MHDAAVITARPGGEDRSGFVHAFSMAHNGRFVNRYLYSFTAAVPLDHLGSAPVIQVRFTHGLRTTTEHSIADHTEADNHAELLEAEGQSVGVRFFVHAYSMAHPGSFVNRYIYSTLTWRN